MLGGRRASWWLGKVGRSCLKRQKYSKNSNDRMRGFSLFAWRSILEFFSSSFLYPSVPPPSLLVPGDQTQGPEHAEHMLFPWAVSPVLSLSSSWMGWVLCLYMCLWIGRQPISPADHPKSHHVLAVELEIELPTSRSVFRPGGPWNPTETRPSEYKLYFIPSVCGFGEQTQGFLKPSSNKLYSQHSNSSKWGLGGENTYSCRKPGF